VDTPASRSIEQGRPEMAADERIADVIDLACPRATRREARGRGRSGQRQVLGPAHCTAMVTGVLD